MKENGPAPPPSGDKVGGGKGVGEPAECRSPPAVQRWDLSDLPDRSAAETFQLDGRPAGRANEATRRYQHLMPRKVCQGRVPFAEG